MLVLLNWLISQNPLHWYSSLWALVKSSQLGKFSRLYAHFIFLIFTILPQNRFYMMIMSVNPTLEIHRILQEHFGDCCHFYCQQWLTHSQSSISIVGPIFPFPVTTAATLLFYIFFLLSLVSSTNELYAMLSVNSIYKGNLQK